MRILLQSNAPWVSTGYGVLAKNLLHRWKNLGHDVACFCFNGLYGGVLELDGIKMFPLGKELWGRDKLVPYSKMFNADITMTFLDVWAIPEVANMDIKWVPYVPIDHDPCPDAIGNVLKGAYRIASMSQNGEKLLKDRGLESAPIPHGVDTQIYKPLEDKGKWKQLLGFQPTDFVVGIVAMNKGIRKNYPDMFEAFAKFKERHSNAKLYLHTDPTRPDGLDLVKMSHQFGIQGDIALSDTNLLELGFPPEKMNEVFNGFDVTLMTTAGEGFGLPIIESQACGVPVITNDFTTGKELNAFPELVLPVGRRYMDALMSYQALTDIDACVEAMEEIYLKGSESYRDKCVEFAQGYDWDKAIVPMWDKFFKEIELDLGIKKES